MNEKERALLILKAKFSNNRDVINVVDAIIQLKRPEVLLNEEETNQYRAYAEEWSNKGWIIYVPPAQPPQTTIKFLDDVDNVNE